MGRNNNKHKWKKVDLRILGFSSKEKNGADLQDVERLSVEVQRDVFLASKNQFSDLDFSESEVNRVVSGAEPLCNNTGASPISCGLTNKLTNRSNSKSVAVDHRVSGFRSADRFAAGPSRELTSRSVAVDSSGSVLKSLDDSPCHHLGAAGADPLRGQHAIFHVENSDRYSEDESDLDYVPSKLPQSVSTSFADSGCAQGNLDHPMHNIEVCDKPVCKDVSLQFQNASGKKVRLSHQRDFASSTSKGKSKLDACPQRVCGNVSSELGWDLRNVQPDPSIIIVGKNQEPAVSGFLQNTQHVCENDFADLGWDLRKVQPDSSIKIVGKNFEAIKSCSLQNLGQQGALNDEESDLNVAESGLQTKNSGQGGKDNLILGNPVQVSLDNQANNIHLIEKEKSVAKSGGNKIGEAKMIKDWKSLFSENRKVNSGLSLQKFDSSLQFVELNEDDFELNENYEWKHCLVGYFSGKFPGFIALKNLVANTWKVHVSIHRHDSGWIIFKFQCKEDMDGVIQNGPYAIYGRSLILKIMPTYFSFDASELSCFPVWVQVKNLPLSAWSPIPLGKILSFIGTPLCTDKVTATRERISFVRALVEVDVAHELPSKVEVKLPDNCMHSFPIIYENLPLFCNICKKLGHEHRSCSKAPKSEGPKKVSSNKKTNDGDKRAGNIDVQETSSLHDKSAGLATGLDGSFVKPLHLNSPNSGVIGGVNRLSTQQNSVLGLSVQQNVAQGLSLEQGEILEAGNDGGQRLFGAIRKGLSVHQSTPSVAGNFCITKNDELPILSPESSQEKAVQTCKKSRFEIKQRTFSKPIENGTQSSLLQRFVNVIEHACSRDLMDNWVNYMEESLGSVGAG